MYKKNNTRSKKTKKNTFISYNSFNNTWDVTYTRL